jgi:hypothetical protein
MQKIVAVALVICLMLCLAGCGDNKKIDGTTYGTYGLLDFDDMKNPDIEYRVIWGNVFWGVVLIETVIAPIYFFGFSLFEPVGKKPAIKGKVH